MSLATTAGFALPARRVVAVLEALAATTALPKAICGDNGPEFAGKELDAWAYRRGVKLCFSRPGKPTDNAFIESFNGKLRDECLNTHWFRDLEEAQKERDAWRKEYNEVRPHRSLGIQTPMEFAARWPSEAAANVRS